MHGVPSRSQSSSQSSVLSPHYSVLTASSAVFCVCTHYSLSAYQPTSLPACQSTSLPVYHPSQKLRPVLSEALTRRSRPRPIQRPSLHLLQSSTSRHSSSFNRHTTARSLLRQLQFLAIHSNTHSFILNPAEVLFGLSTGTRLVCNDLNVLSI